MKHASMLVSTRQLDLESSRDISALILVNALCSMDWLSAQGSSPCQTGMQTGNDSCCNLAPA